VFKFSWVDLDAGLDESGPTDSFEHRLWKEQLIKARYLEQSSSVFMFDLRGVDSPPYRYQMLRDRAIQFAVMAASKARRAGKAPRLPESDKIDQIVLEISRNERPQWESVPMWFAAYASATRKLDDSLVATIFPEEIQLGSLEGKKKSRSPRGDSSDEDGGTPRQKPNSREERCLTSLRDHFGLYQNLTLDEVGLISYTSAVIRLPLICSADRALRELENGNLFRGPMRMM
jgi:hypothetical protein